MSTLCALHDAAVQINAEHALALKHADQAIEHARRVGQMLLAVKQSLPHGEFQTWLASNVSVSARQARRYMAAAAGKPLPIRTMVSPLKMDTVSVLSAVTVVDPMPTPALNIEAQNPPTPEHHGVASGGERETVSAVSAPLMLRLQQAHEATAEMRREIERNNRITCWKQVKAALREAVIASHYADEDPRPCPPDHAEAILRDLAELNQQVRKYIGEKI